MEVSRDTIRLTVMEVGRREDRGLGKGEGGRDDWTVEGWKSMERLTRDDDVPANSNPAQVLYSFDLHGPSSNEENAQLARILGPEPDVDTSRECRKGDGSRRQEHAISSQGVLTRFPKACNERTMIAVLVIEVHRLLPQS